MKDQRPVILIHGYGVRGFFWEPLAEQLSEHFERVIHPDIDLASIDTALNHVQSIIDHQYAEGNHKVILIGHSMGGILSALSAVEDAGAKVDKLVVMASPFGARRQKMNPLLKFLLRFRLLPGWAVRAQFFGRNTPLELQKGLFSRAVKESDELQKEITRDKWFHTDLIKHPGTVEVQGIASEGDRIVSASETSAFVAALGGNMEIFPLKAEIGHDDFPIHQPAIDAVLNVVLPFLKTSSQEPVEVS